MQYLQKETIQISVFRLALCRKREIRAILVFRARGVRAIRACDAFHRRKARGQNNEYQHTHHANVGAGTGRDAGRGVPDDR